jgi:teichoic acid transport system permease protein
MSKLRIVLTISFNEFKTEYAGLGLGMIWLFVKPLVMIMVLNVVHTEVFKTPDVDGTPFIVWLALGIVPWLFLSDTMTTASYSIRSKSYLVKKMAFDPKLITIIQIVKQIFAFFLLLLIIFMFIFIHKIPLSAYTLQVLYYIFAAYMFLMAFSRFYAPLVVMSPDMGQLLIVIMQILFWTTPIMWIPSMLENSSWGIVFKLSPLFYLVEGFRDTFIGRAFFWENLNAFISFWVIIFIIYIIGNGLFAKFSKEFDDVL